MSFPSAYLMLVPSRPGMARGGQLMLIAGCSMVDKYQEPSFF